MPVRPTRLTPARAALGLALGTVLLAASLPARAEDDLPIDRKIFRGVLEGLGLRDADRPDINYQERAPLVIPPSRGLPPPETSNAAVANNPAWPKDPDVMRRKREAELDAKRVTSDERELEQNPLRPDQLTPGGNPRSVRVSRGAPYTATPGDRLSADEMNQKRSIWSKIFSRDDEEEVGKFTREPTRNALTAPPPGYQTPSPDQPYGLSKASKSDKPKADNYSETHGTLESRENRN